MPIHTFQTNINCGNCIKAITPHLNGELAIERWAVDTDDPRKPLTVEAEADLSAQEIIAIVARAGFTAAPLPVS